MSRSKTLLGRVLRNLKRYGLKENETLDEEIYGELTVAQNNIISNIQPSSFTTITLKTNIEYYPLEMTKAGSTPINKPNIISIKVVSLPPELDGAFSVISNIEFVDRVSSKSIATSGKPAIGTVIDNQLRIRPIPTSEYNDKKIELYVYKKMSITPIDKDNEPEIGEEFDKALELYATSQFLSGRDRNEMLTEYMLEVKRLFPLTHRSRGTISVKPLTGW